MNRVLEDAVIEGPTLEQLIGERRSFAAREAVAVSIGMLDDLVAAHAEGRVHRALEPAQVLVGADRRARLTGYGNTAAATGARYKAPEAARGETATPAIDVYAAGVVLAEMLCGERLFETVPPGHEFVVPPLATIDDRLHGIVQRALRHEAAERHPSAAAFRDALLEWLEASGAPGEGDGAMPGTLERLLQRMREQADFPALSSSVVSIQRVAGSDTESLASLTGEILKDVALTNKLLRMVNSVHFAQAASGGVGTVSRAIALVGFAGIRNMALALVLLEHMGNKGQASLLAEEFARALMAGTLASELSGSPHEAEAAFLGSMFQNLGRLLAEYYFPEEAQSIRDQLAPGADHAAREAAAGEVLGLGFDEIGAGVAQVWGLPESLASAMRPPAGPAPPRAVQEPIERLRWIGRSANALTDALLAAEGPAQVQALQAAADGHSVALGSPTREVLGATERARVRWLQMSQALGLPLAGMTQTRRLLVPAGAPVPAGHAAVGAATRSGNACDRAAAPPPAGGATAACPNAAAGEISATARVLAEGLSALMAPGAAMALNERLNLVLETLHKGLRAHGVVLCLRDTKLGELVGRVGLGVGGAALKAAFRVQPAAGVQGDLFAALCARGADTLLADTRSAALVARMPAWYRGKLQAPSFLLLPMVLQGAPIGLIYADRFEGAPIVLDETEMRLVRALRDQAVAGFTRHD